SGLAPAQVCAHPINGDGSLGAMVGCIATCAQPLELYVLADRVIVTCTSGMIASHTLDAMQLPAAAMLTPLAVRGTWLGSALYATTTTDELVRLDPLTMTELGRTPVAAGAAALATSADDRFVFAGDPTGVVAYDRDAGYAAVAGPTDIGGAAISIVVE